MTEQMTVSDLLDLGRAAVRAERWPAAIAAFCDGLALEADNAELHYRLGWALGKTGDLDAADAECIEAISLEPDDFMARYMWAWVRHMRAENEGLRERWIELHKAAEEAMEILPDGHTTRFGEWLLHFRVEAGVALSDLTGAIAAVEQFLFRFPESDWAQNRLVQLRVGNLLAQATGLIIKCKWHPAIAVLRQALTLNSLEIEVHAWLGWALAEAGQFDEAIRHCEAAIRLNPADFLGHRSYTLVLLRRAERTRSKELWREAGDAAAAALAVRPIEIDPDDLLSLTIVLANAEIMQGHRQRAYELLGEFVKDHPDSVDGRVAYATVSAFTGRWRQGWKATRSLMVMPSLSHLHITDRTKRNDTRTKMLVVAAGITAAGVLAHRKYRKASHGWPIAH